MELIPIRTAKRWLDAFLGFFYPECCQICRQFRATAATGYVCTQCRQDVRHVAAPFCSRCGLPFGGAVTNEFECTNCRELELEFESARAAVVAAGVTLEVIHRYKYQRGLWFEPFLADLLVGRAAAELAAADWDAIIPVPLHPVKQREREFNQAERLARRLGRATGIPVNARLVRRVEATRTQTRLSRDERAANVKKAFAVRDGIQLNGERLVVLDDVLTTGATTSAVAGVLRRAGAGRVCVWSVARGV